MRFPHILSAMKATAVRQFNKMAKRLMGKAWNQTALPLFWQTLELLHTPISKHSQDQPSLHCRSILPNNLLCLVRICPSVSLLPSSPASCYRAPRACSAGPAAHARQEAHRTARGGPAISCATSLGARALDAKNAQLGEKAVVWPGMCSTCLCSPDVITLKWVHFLHHSQVLQCRAVANLVMRLRFLSPNS